MQLFPGPRIVIVGFMLVLSETLLIQAEVAFRILRM